MTEPNNPPYLTSTAALVGVVVDLCKRVFEQHPDALHAPGSIHVAIDASTGQVVVALREGDALIVVEQIYSNPQEPATFGRSALPYVDPALLQAGARTH